MELHLQIKMNPKLYVRDPELSELGRSIVRESITMIHEIGFEEFTFKKLAAKLQSTEASIYRYFENKHRLLTYLTTWYWTRMEYELVFHTNNMQHARDKIVTIVELLCFRINEQHTMEHVDKYLLHAIVIDEGNKAYLTKRVTEDNKARLFKPYKDLCHRIAQIFLEYQPRYRFPHSLASTLIETAHHQIYFKDHLPSLTDFPNDPGTDSLSEYLQQLVFSALGMVKKGK